jgi:hypothetical protein
MSRIQLVLVIILGCFGILWGVFSLSGFFERFIRVYHRFWGMEVAGDISAIKICNFAFGLILLLSSVILGFVLSRIR